MDKSGPEPTRAHELTPRGDREHEPDALQNRGRMDFKAAVVPSMNWRAWSDIPTDSGKTKALVRYLAQPPSLCFKHLKSSCPERIE